jgi:uncharacterized phage protein (TIGR01671 family)
MREIKFRAWDIINRKMYKCAGFLSGQVIIIEDDGKVLGKNDEGFILMQFTGLKDKHGKEIYEGDIIQYDYDLHLQYPKEVKYQDGMFRKVSQRQQWNALYIDIDRYEVIGNIYENPGLIGGTQKEEK